MRGRAKSGSQHTANLTFIEVTARRSLAHRLRVAPLTTLQNRSTIVAPSRYVENLPNGFDVEYLGPFLSARSPAGLAPGRIVSAPWRNLGPYFGAGLKRSAQNARHGDDVAFSLTELGRCCHCSVEPPGTVRKSLVPILMPRPG